MYKLYIVGKVHCGENLCVLVGCCGENTHIPYMQTIHYGESALWGKSVRPSWSLWGKHTHTVHANYTLCGKFIVGKICESSLVVVGKYTHTVRTNYTLCGKCIVGKIWVSSLVVVGKIHTHCTYKLYIVGKVHCGENLCVLLGRCGENTHIPYVQTIHCRESALWGKSVRPSWSLWGKHTHTVHANYTLCGKCIVGKICESSLVVVVKIHTHCTYKLYIVGKVHCGENLCVLVGCCGENTHIPYTQTIHYGESALWGKSVNLVGRCGENTHTLYVQTIHCGESALWRKSVRPSWLLWGKYTHTVHANDTLWGK